jgi:diguanylate cyclase (GGDEF)-like protein
MKHRLARRMLAWILGISAVAALIATSIQLFFDYRRDLSELEQGMHYIEQNQLPGLSDAAWNFNIPSMQLQLEGIGRSPWVAGVSLRYGPRQAAELTTGQIATDSHHLYTYELHRNDAVVGKIYIYPNLDVLYRRTIDRFVVVLSTQIGKSLITTISIFLLMTWLITRPLTQMAAFAQAFQPGQNFRPFRLRRRETSSPDELTVLVDALNDAYQRIQKAHEFEVQHAEILSREVAERTRELSAAHQELARLSVTDKLTGILNRLGLDETLQSAITTAKKEQRALSLIITDIDHFKQVNDQHGHLTGDQLLQEFARILQQTIPATAVLGRWGGEEFLIICPDSNPEQTRLLAEQLRTAVENHIFPVVGHKTSSFGVASLSESDSSNDLLRHADNALYEAKRGGRNRVALAKQSGNMHAENTKDQVLS